MLHLVAQMQHPYGRLSGRFRVQLAYEEVLSVKFEEKLIRLRKSRGISQEELAEQLNVSRQAVSRWEQGSTLPDIPNLRKLCDLFQVSADELIREEESDFAIPTPPVSQPKEASPSTVRHQNAYLYLFATFSWLLAAICFLIAAYTFLSVVFLALVLVDVVLACVNFYLYQKTNKRKDR